MSNVNSHALSLVWIVLAAGALSGAPASQTFTGVITDSECSKGDHSQMRMGPTAAECTAACITYHGALYVLYDGSTVYELNDQKTPQQFAGQRVKVTGTLDPKSKTKTIQVESIAAFR